ncbi:MAG: ribosomal protein S18-alanine N-acetyltransferase [Lachnospiraceae bacterium]|nr:ribosomal protein S18-alanine N-acetyltransferase [Lachnospiraceae bacterium]
MEEEILITEMTEADCDAVTEMETTYFTDSWVREDFSEGIKDENFHFLVARRQNEVAGYAVICFAADESELINICVREDVRRLGIARKLLKSQYITALNEGALSMYLEVRESNVKARALYMSEGFKEIGVRKWYYKKPAEHAIIMVKDLKTAPPGVGNEV